MHQDDESACHLCSPAISSFIIVDQEGESLYFINLLLCGTLCLVVGLPLCLLLARSVSQSAERFVPSVSRSVVRTALMLATPAGPLPK